ncbi:MAG: CoA-binding protein [Anaerolineae bacterium]|nr:CoA-binding protein [Anaerolineae bacterium]NUQ04816.1 CoA-binding protein [Anaerolineae bacterium]
MALSRLTHRERVDDFLAQKRIAICGLSRSKDSGAGAIYLKLRDHGYQVFAVHPSAEALHGDDCYPTLSAIPGGVDAVFIMNSPDVTEQLADEALSLGIRRVWMHNNTMMPSSVSDAAATRCRDAGINLIDVGCPMMFLEPDFFHSCMRWMIRARGKMK